MLPSILLYCLWYIHPIQNPKSRSLNTAGAIRDQTQIPTQSQDVTIFTQTAALLAFMVCKSESGLSKRGEHKLELRNNLHQGPSLYYVRTWGQVGGPENGNFPLLYVMKMFLRRQNVDGWFKKALRNIKMVPNAASTCTRVKSQMAISLGVCN